MTEWGEEEDFGGHEIVVEPYAAFELPPHLKYRSFGCSESRKCSSTFSDDDCLPRKRLRAEMESSEVCQTVATRLSDAFHVSQRQLHSFRWLEQRPRAAEIVEHFQLDRRRGTPPSTAATNRVLTMLPRDGDFSYLADFVEDLVFYGNRAADSTFFNVLGSMRAEPPAVVAMLLHSLNLVSGPSTALRHQRCLAICKLLAAAQGPSLQVSSSNLASAAPASLTPECREVFTLYYQELLSNSKEPIPIAVQVSYGLCLLSHSAPFTQVAEVVRRSDLLSAAAAAADPASYFDTPTRRILGRFLSAFFEMYCTKTTTTLPGSARGGTDAANTEDGTRLMAAAAAACFAHSVPLSETACVGLVARFFKSRQYDSVVGTFLGMFATASGAMPFPILQIAVRAMTLSGPGSPSPSSSLPACRWPELASSSGAHPILIVAAVLQRDGRHLFGSAAVSYHSHHGQLRTLLASEGFTACRDEGSDEASGMTCEEGELARQVEAFGAELGHLVGTHHRRYAPQLLAAVNSVQRQLALIDHDGSHSAPNLSTPFALALYEMRDHNSSPKTSASETISVDEALLQAVLHVTVAPCSVPSPAQDPFGEAKYRNVLSWTVLLRLASSPTEEMAFVKMMRSYSKKGGAVAITVPENFDRAFWQPAMFKLLQRWSTHPWFIPLRHSWSLPTAREEDQFKQNKVLKRYASCVALARTTAERKVAFFTNDKKEGESATELGVSPVVLLDALLSQLVKTS